MHEKNPLVCKSTHWKEVTYIFDQRWGLGMCIVIFLNVICLLFFKRLKGSHTNDVRCLVWYVNQFVESITTALKRTSLSIFNIVKLFDALYRTFVPKSRYCYTQVFPVSKLMSLKLLKWPERTIFAQIFIILFV